MTIDAQANLRSMRDVLRYAVTRFNDRPIFFGHGQLDAFDEAALLVTRALKLPLERMDIFLDAFLTHAEINTLLELIERRVKKRVPVAYLLGEGWLQGYRFLVDARVIIPRSFIAELLKDQLAPWIGDPASVRSVLDMCTGSGCLAVIAADLFPNAKVDAVDISVDALAVAARNVEDYSLGDRVRLVESDLFQDLKSSRYDLILCNPPYVTDEALAKLPREYSHEPTLALAGGPDGLDIVRRVMGEARAHLNPQGLLVMEVGDGRPAFEREYPRVPVVWATTSAGDDMVFVARAEDLSVQAPAARSAAA
ncbi:MAG TPA: 50S ribosomal protein L3 N(5)-glutamine methyltransferase [Burkholderiaceae bacterium]|jgi:ribosomal protein L3 glutamine methyltransferase|nr:50S ribosomal protein L3 N(5)-glutamine methyltransferase [Burkholderiaceae bacterium]